MNWDPLYYGEYPFRELTKLVTGSTKNPQQEQEESTLATKAVTKHTVASAKKLVKDYPTYPTKTVVSKDESYTKEQKEKAKDEQDDQTKEDKDWQEEYNRQIQSLLAPMQNAVGALPGELSKFMSGYDSTYDLGNADDLATGLAKQYSSAITANLGSQPAGLTAAENSAVKTAETMSGVMGALKGLSSDFSSYAKSVPYEDIAKALLSREQYETMYGTTPADVVAPSANWPSWLQKTYEGVTGKTIGKNAASNVTAKGVTVPGLTTSKSGKGSTTGQPKTTGLNSLG